MHTQDDLVAARRMAVETHIDHAYIRMVDVGLHQNIESLPGSLQSFRVWLGHDLMQKHALQIYR
jgi:hypothetical protein